MRIAIALVVAIAMPARAELDAGSAGPDVVDVSRAVIDELLPDGGVGARIVLIGGCWLSSEYCMGYSKELADKRDRVKYLEEHSADAPKAWITGALVIGAVLGAAAGYFAPHPTGKWPW